MVIDRILPNLYVGMFPAGPEDVQALKEQGVTAVLNLQSDEDFRQCGIDWPVLLAGYATQGIEARRVPITDFDDDDLREKLPEAVRLLVELLKQEHTVFVHCNAGMNRSPSVAVCYLHWIEGWGLEEAEQHVRRCRRCSPAMDVIRRASRNRPSAPPPA